MNATLELIPLIRAGVKYADGTYKSERHFLDFVVNGQSLWETLGKRHDMVSILCVEFPADQTAKAVNRLLSSEKAALPDDRRSLFVCSECGDLGCGTITARVEKQGEAITWKDFGYENDYEDKVKFDEYSIVGPFRFQSTSYEQILLKGLDSFTPR
jgi:hypothetical protein